MSGPELDNTVLRQWCRGLWPLPARLEPWQVEVLGDGPELARVVEDFDSPINLINPGLLAGHAEELLAAARAHQVSARVFFARKANKALGLVDAALAAGHGVDVASEHELVQVLERGASASDVILTAAIKPRRLLERAIRAGVTISIDNLDEFATVTNVAVESGRTARVALRCAPEGGGIPPSRFGLTTAGIRQLLVNPHNWSLVQLAGFHFHLAGYDVWHRVTMLDRVLDLVGEARQQGLTIDFIDIGGGVPMRYLDSEQPWLDFWEAHRRSLLSDEQSMIWADGTLGLRVQDGEVRGTSPVYPMWQEPVRGAWLEEMLAAHSRAGGSIAERLRSAGVALHLEPGRSLLDGCGLTVARVESRKRAPDGTWFIGLAMNRTQCRSAAEDFLLDPIVVPAGTGDRTEPIECFLVGAYCIEAELLTRRRLSLPQGIALGDLVVFVNTAGYMMHILESASHQIPLARNLLLAGDKWVLDDIDR